MIDLTIHGEVFHIITMCAISAFGTEDCSEKWEIILTDNMFYCGSNTSCTLPEHNTVFLNIKRLDRVDGCGRHPLEHEILHIQYPDRTEEVHDDCTIQLDEKILREKLNEIKAYLPASIKQELVQPEKLIENKINKDITTNDQEAASIEVKPVNIAIGAFVLFGIPAIVIGLIIVKIKKSRRKIEEK